MRFFKTVMLAAVTAGVMSTQAVAQPIVDVKVTGTAYAASVGAPYNANGGGFNALISGLPANITLVDNIVYCFDVARQFTFNTTYQYKVLTFAQFVAAAPTGNTWENINNVAELNAMAFLASQYPNPALPTNAQIQKDIWDISSGAVDATGYAGPDLSGSWLVLVDANSWANGDKGVQSFLVQGTLRSTVTPEPSTYVLMAAGLAGLLVANRRRRQTNV